MTFEDRQRERRAAGKVGTAALLAGMPAAERAHAERILAHPMDDGPKDPVALAAEVRDAIGALRMLNAKRELAEVGHFLADQPDHPHARHWRARFVELTGYVRLLERSGAVRPRAWESILAREGQS